MPVRAEDAAIVQVTLRTMLSPAISERVVAITLCNRPEPRTDAARFELGPSVSEISRACASQLYDVHAVAELSDGHST